jgi:lambda family phage portal protein
MARRIVKSHQEAFEGLKSDYAAAKVSRFRRRRQGIASGGSGADYHYRSEGDFLRIMEYARDMDRNDAIPGQMVTRAVDNIVQGGQQPDPKTGDAKLDLDLKTKWWNWATNKQACSLDGEYTYLDLEQLALRHMFIDGDVFALPLDSGHIEMVEAHRCRTPSSTKRNVVHGILMDDNRRRLQYWFTKEDVDPSRAVVKVGEIEPREAFDDEGNPAVIHLRNPARVSQTRGLSALSPVFDLIGMHEDLQFTKLVQQQVASCIAFIRERTADFQAGTIQPYGEPNTQTYDTTTRIVEDLAPGIELRGLKGEKITGFSPNIPNAEFFQQMRTILQLIGVNLGMPLVLLLMDASDTNFSGWRGAMDQAKMGFRRLQRHLINHFETPLYHWKLRQFIREDRAMRTAAAALGDKFFAHEWNSPRWPYIQPLQDSQADANRQKELQASPRRIHAGFAQDWNDSIDETCEDNGYAIRKAIAQRDSIFKETGERVHWRDCLFLTNVEQLKLTVTASPASPQQPLLPAPANEPKGDPEDDTRDDEDKPEDSE